MIPTVVGHQFKGMGKLVDSDQIKEEIVAVVDEVRSLQSAGTAVIVECKSYRQKSVEQNYGMLRQE